MTPFSTSTADCSSARFPTAQSDECDLFMEAQGTPFSQPPDRAESCRAAGQQSPVGLKHQTMDKTMLNTTPLNEAQRESVAAALNSIGASPRDIVAIFQSLKQLF